MTEAQELKIISDIEDLERELTDCSDADESEFIQREIDELENMLANDG